MRPESVHLVSRQLGAAEALLRAARPVLADAGINSLAGLIDQWLEGQRAMLTSLQSEARHDD
jgi:hypothetical protein